ncbi:MAG TPA: transcriptional regulator, partial [Ruminococcaceae bacterium]|nr:transcriptional regulator [Oscillospiraceae bacterium]
MLYLAENLKKYRIIKDLTQEEVADYLGVTPQSVSKWERSECCPDITLLPALANIFETSIDLLMGMDTVRSEETIDNIHSTATDFQRQGDYSSAEKVYRNAMKIYPNNPEMLLGLAGTLALKGDCEEAAALTEKGLSLSDNEKQKSTMRAALCFLYLQCGNSVKAMNLASTLPHTRESREVIVPLISKGLSAGEIDSNIKYIIL